MDRLDEIKARRGKITSCDINDWEGKLSWFWNRETTDDNVALGILTSIDLSYNYPFEIYATECYEFCLPLVKTLMNNAGSNTPNNRQVSTNLKQKLAKAQRDKRM